MSGDFGVFVEQNCFQLVLEDGDFKEDNTLETAVIISLWTDARVSVDELPPGITDRKGWWGDMFPDVEGDQIGSKIWTLSRSKTTNETLAALENYVAEALEWMVDDGVASNVDVGAEYDDSNQAIVSISISRPDGEQDRFSAQWDSQELLRA